MTFNHTDLQIKPSLHYFYSVGAPSIPHAPHLDNTSCSSLTFSWTIPNNRGNPITHYFVRYRQSSVDTWNAVKVSSSSIPNATLQVMTLESLLPATLYKIQVSAANEIGNSSFSDITYGQTTYPGIIILVS